MKTTLHDKLFLSSFETGRKMIMDLSPDRLLAPCFDAMGKEPKAERYGGWEAKGISGHTLGHYMSALSFLYAANGNSLAKERAEYCVNTLKNLQNENGYIAGFPENESFDKVFSNPDGFTAGGFELAGWWVPYYSLHKIFRGLIDIYENIGTADALTVAEKLGEWTYKTTSTLNPEQRLRLLKCEYGGMNDVLSRLYKHTENEHFKEAAEFFCEENLLIPLSKGEDILSNLHANTQIPKIIGSLEVYENGGEEYLYSAAKFFWDTVVNRRSYAIGGHGAGEHFCKDDEKPLKTNTCETCNTNNMITLSEMLWKREKNSKYFDYIENALYNHILPSQDETGMKTYFVGLAPGNFKVYSTPEDSFWCCFGSGLENPFTYNKLIFNYGKGLYVNLYIDSAFECEDVSVRLNSLGDDIKTLEFTSDYNGTVYLRKPVWCKNFKVEYKDGEISDCENGYVKITCFFKKGDTVKIYLPREIEKHIKNDDNSFVYFTYGEIVLAEFLGNSNCPESDHAAGENDFTEQELIYCAPLKNTDIKKIGEMKFSVDGHTLCPFFEILHGRYRIYFETK
ncbi:MAG: glycoside hydrolase family 127 protein [Oscillospiraceae bacterium]|nr:glycoside hydrolase family 127 protein [Oscillospiraceae bacterium]